MTSQRPRETPLTRLCVKYKPLLQTFTRNRFDIMAPSHSLKHQVLAMVSPDGAFWILVLKASNYLPNSMAAGCASDVTADTLYLMPLSVLSPTAASASFCVYGSARSA